MIPLDVALQIVDGFAASTSVGTETIDIRNSAGRVLAADAVSKLSLPPFNKSAMDGYAVMADDERDEYQVLEFIAAGSVPAKPLKPGTASKVMTGAPVPENAGKVIMVEFTEQTGGKIRVTKHSDKPNICIKGEDIKPGDIILKAPAKLGPLETANLISTGISEVQVYKKIRVAVISTGDEIVNNPAMLTDGKIMDSNGPLLEGLCEKHSLEVTSLQTVKDDRKTTVKAIKAAMDTSDIVILTGGVSMGDMDFVDTAMNDLGLKVHFNRVAVKPGKPMTFASAENKAVFGLPGNPVSVYLMFHLFVLPAAEKICGLQPPQITQLPISEDFKRKKTDRTLYAPAEITPLGKLKPIKYHGSAHLLALTKADGFFIVEKGTSEINQNEKVKFMRVK